MLTSERCGPFTVNNKLLTRIHTTFAKLHGISLDLSLEPPSQDFQTLPTERLEITRVLYVKKFIK